MTNSTAVEDVYPLYENDYDEIEFVLQKPR